MHDPLGHSLHLTRSLLDYMGIASDGLEEEHKILLSIDYEISIFIVIESGLVHFVGTLGTAPRSQAFYRSLLEENYKDCTRADYGYSIEPESGELLMSRTVRGEGIEAGDLIREFEGFVRRSEAWSDSLRAGRDDIPGLTVADRAPERSARIAPGQVSFTKV